MVLDATALAAIEVVETLEGVVWLKPWGTNVAFRCFFLCLGRVGVVGRLKNTISLLILLKGEWTFEGDMKFYTKNKEFS